MKFSIPSLEELTGPQQEWLKQEAELFSKQRAEDYDRFVLLHIKKRPSWLSEKIYRFLLKELINIDEFRKN